MPPAVDQGFSPLKAGIVTMCSFMAFGTHTLHARALTHATTARRSVGLSCNSAHVTLSSSFAAPVFPCCRRRAAPSLPPRSHPRRSSLFRRAVIQRRGTDADDPVRSGRLQRSRGGDRPIRVVEERNAHGMQWIHRCRHRLRMWMAHLTTHGAATGSRITHEQHTHTATLASSSLCSTPVASLLLRIAPLLAVFFRWSISFRAYFL